MDFDLTEEQRSLQKTVRQFTEREIEPVAHLMDLEGRLPDDLIKKMAKQELLGMTLPVEYGGSNYSSLDCVLAIEQLSYSGTGAWWLVAFCNSIPGCIVEFGSEEQKEKYLRVVCEGNAYPSIQFTEADTGSDPDMLITRAVPEGDNYVINGTKRFSTFGARDGYAILYARDDSGKCTAFITEKNIGGYSATHNFELMGSGGVETVDVRFDNLKLPKESILGEKGRGMKILQSWVAYEKNQQCGACLGIGNAALDEAIYYVKNRRVRGKSQIGLQGIQWMLADIYTQLEAARCFTYRAAFLKDKGAVNRMTEAAATKLFVVPSIVAVVNTARQIHGAYGYTKEFKIERLYRAIAGASAIAVSLEINKSIVASSLIK
ncbi:acyl-CoA dehydrogenase family protein, partial [Thermodesulfobacteriota bacterium]